MTNVLKPCPFCGSPIQVRRDILSNRFYLRHHFSDSRQTECSFANHLSNQMFSNDDAAITAWNTRLDFSRPQNKKQEYDAWGQGI